jgi:hypothetical protein
LDSEDIGAYQASKTLFLVPESIRDQLDPNPTEREIVDLYLAGNSIMAINMLTMVPRERVRAILHRFGVPMRHTREIYHEPAVRLDRDVALLLGLHCGDGHLSDSWGISVCGKDIEMEDVVTSLIREVLGVEPYVEYRRDGYFIVKSGKQQVREFFKRYGFSEGKKAGTVRVPCQVLVSKDADVWIGFLKGAFSADGCFWFKNNWGQCRFEVSSRHLRDGFMNLAGRLDFHFRAYSYIHQSGHNRLPLHLAYLGVKSEVKRWMETVGSISDTHLRRYQEWTERIGD